MPLVMTESLMFQVGLKAGMGVQSSILGPRFGWTIDFCLLLFFLLFLSAC